MNMQEVIKKNQKWENIFSLFDEVSKIKSDDLNWINDIFDQLILDEHELSDSFFEDFLDKFKNIFVVFKNKPIKLMLLENTIELLQIDSKFTKRWLLFLTDFKNEYINTPEQNHAEIKDLLLNFQKTSLNSKQEGIYFLFFDYLKTIGSPISLDLRFIFNTKSSSKYTLEALRYYKHTQKNINPNSFFDSYEYWLKTEIFNCKSYGFTEFSEFNLKKYYPVCLFFINDIITPILSSDKKQGTFLNLEFCMNRFLIQISYAMNDKNVFRESLKKWKNNSSSLDAELILKSCAQTGISDSSKINLFSEMKSFSSEWHKQLNDIVLNERKMMTIIKELICSSTLTSQKVLNKESWMLPQKIKLSDSLYSKIPFLIKDSYPLESTSYKYYNKVFGILDEVPSKFFNESFKYEELIGGFDPKFALFIKNCVNQKNEKVLLQNLKCSVSNVRLNNRF